MDRAERRLRDLLKESGTFVRSSGHDVYLLTNGHKVSIRRPNKKGHQDHWKSALSYVRRVLRRPKAG
jgi:hypothetical protein